MSTKTGFFHHLVGQMQRCKHLSSLLAVQTRLFSSGADPDPANGKSLISPASIFSFYFLPT
jgi:hypothetical protein